ncbi:TetR family transcriptional regulator [Desulfobacter hydrogenophilus]|uniref:FtsQ-type POTRA domain-containing protein n=1 Tax=Desulfobacter hydrogenophilus TaxID=2291 RepID=A0A328FC39_9BACT|nr:FtsQ-type POTRA domain-containing protein [Desulfobacter hydrogenophilus]NDY73580.1 FtsQ-type POTRA domain-containing protein [Desulfobacter hydrogenophilus]QBH13673.1 FtsQ-type POTRA domain-containing protein [Desulfobacter hydrogenophilus]RAM01859.1 TetR family transcriptional regulator [Desulfobacter hydrogenophilus]
MATKKITQNKYKAQGKKTRKLKTFFGGKALWGKFFLILFVGAMSFGCIYIHDAVLQSPLFDVKTIMIDGLDRVTRDELLARIGLDKPSNIFELQPDLLEKKLNTHPWIRMATVKRQLLSTISIKIEEQEPLAIVTIENLADIVINAQGAPFKEYEPAKDDLKALPVISGVDLSLSNSTYLFEGDLFNAVMEILRIKGFGQIKTILGDENTGILINILNTYPDTNFTKNLNDTESENKTIIPVKLGFDGFEEKLARARQIQRYIETNYPGKTISAIDLFSLEKVFVTTEDAAQHTIEKGV